MKKLIIGLLLLGSQAFAGQAHLKWITNSYQEGSPLTNTTFRILWGVEGQVLENEIDYGPPAKSPDSLVDETATWEENIIQPQWTNGLKVCFQLAVLISGHEIGRSPITCKAFNGAPTEVVIYYP